MRQQLPTVTIGIAAYNSEKNIKRLLTSLVKQQETFFAIDKILVYADGCKDNTVSNAKKIANKKIHVIDAKKNNGFAFVTQYLLGKSKSDFFVLLNDDILIKDDNLIAKVIRPFFQDKKVGLVGGNPQQINKDTFIEKAYYSTQLAYINMRKHIKNGHNAFGCDGKILAFSKEFIKKVHFPKKYAQMGCCDIYFFFVCITKGFLYKHAADAIVYGKSPSTVQDYISLITRVNSIADIKKQFGAIVEKELSKPRFLYYYYASVEFMKNPLGCLFILGTNVYIKLQIVLNKGKISSRWQTLASTKFSLVAALFEL